MLSDIFYNIVPDPAFSCPGYVCYAPKAQEASITKPGFNDRALADYVEAYSAA